jgi:hypothetical protein
VPHGSQVCLYKDALGLRMLERVSKTRREPQCLTRAKKKDSGRGEASQVKHREHPPTHQRQVEVRGSVCKTAGA